MLANRGTEGASLRTTKLFKASGFFKITRMEPKASGIFDCSQATAKLRLIMAPFSGPPVMEETKKGMEIFLLKNFIEVSISAKSISGKALKGNRYLSNEDGRISTGFSRTMRMCSSLRKLMLS